MKETRASGSIQTDPCRLSGICPNDIVISVCQMSEINNFYIFLEIPISHKSEVSYSYLVQVFQSNTMKAQRHMKLVK